MSHERRQLIEKIQVYAAAALCVFLAYCLAWPHLRPGGVDRVAAFLAEGATGSLIAALVMFWLMCLGAGLMTFLTRPQGAMMAATAGLAALGMHSEPTRLLINRYEENLDALGASMIAETLVLAAAVGAGCVLVRMVWLRLARAAVGADQLGAPTRLWLLAGVTAAADEKRRAPAVIGKDFLLGTAGRVAIALFMMQILLNGSVDQLRGQVVFAVFAGFWVSSLAATWSATVVDSDLSAVLAPALAGVGIFVTVMGATPDPPITWMAMKAWTQALPVDWVAAGGCGSLLGRWMALRIIEAGKELPPRQTEYLNPFKRYADARLIASVLRERGHHESEKQ